MLKAADTDGSGEINYTEFLAATIDERTYLREDYLRTAFSMLNKMEVVRLIMRKYKHSYKAKV